jgi:protein involved in sex pheromone biosynthesis
MKKSILIFFAALALAGCGQNQGGTSDQTGTSSGTSSSTTSTVDTNSNISTNTPSAKP